MLDVFDVAGVSLRYTVDEVLGLVWAGPDLVRLAGLTPQQGTQLVNYAPDRVARRVVDIRGVSRSVNLITHRVALYWLQGRNDASDRAVTALEAFATFRKFPIMAAPKMPRRRQRQHDLKRFSNRVDEERAMLLARFHLVTWLDQYEIRVLFHENRAWLWWRDVCPILGPLVGLNPTSQYRRIVDAMPHSKSMIRRFEARDGIDVNVIAPELLLAFTNVGIPESQMLRRALAVPVSDGKTQIDIWHKLAREHLAKHEAWLMSKPARRSLAGMSDVQLRDHQHALRRTRDARRSLNTRVFPPGTPRNMRTAKLAHDYALARETAYDPDIKPE